MWPCRCFAVAGTALDRAAIHLRSPAIGLGLAVLYRQFRGSLGGIRRGVLDLLTLVGWSALPLVLMLLSLAHQEQLAAFVDEVIVGPASWPRELDPREYLGALLLGNPLLIGVGCLGLMELTAAARTDQDRAPAAAVAVLASGSILAGWFTIPVPWPQSRCRLAPAGLRGGDRLLSLCAANGRGLLARGALVLLVVALASSPFPSAEASS